MQDWRLPKALLGVSRKKDSGNEGLREAGEFISERAGDEDRGKATKGWLEVLCQQTSGIFDELIKATLSEGREGAN